MKQSGERG